jgi:hypothetical protein
VCGGFDLGGYDDLSAVGYCARFTVDDNLKELIGVNILEVPISLHILSYLSYIACTVSVECAFDCLTGLSITLDLIFNFFLKYSS